MSRYDANDDGIIDENEYAQALRDYEARIINFNDLSAVKSGLPGAPGGRAPAGRHHRQ